jgi:hypothetical protein
MVQQPIIREPITRAFTYADIEKFYLKHWGKYEVPKYSIVSIELLTDVQPPTWIVEHVGVYSDGYKHEMRTLILTQGTNFDGTPCIDLPIPQKLPTGFSSVQEEDAEIERYKQELLDEWERRETGIKKS